MWDWLRIFFESYPYIGIFIIGLLMGRRWTYRNHKAELERNDENHHAELVRLEESKKEITAELKEQIELNEKRHKNELRRVHALYNKTIAIIQDQSSSSVKPPDQEGLHE